MKLLHPWRLKTGINLGAGNGAGSRSQSASAARGIAYHRRVYRQLERHYADDDCYLIIEPWFVQVDDQPRRTMRSPDAVAVFSDVNAALVIEVKMNWASGRDEKLINEYLPIVKSALAVDTVWPLLITGCCRGYRYPPLLGLQQIDNVFSWEPGRPTPLLLLP